jgi:hypothetical protein
MWISPQHLSRVLFSDQRSIDPRLAGSPRSYCFARIAAGL